MTAPKEIIEILKNSGNSFHAKVARWLADNEWHVIVSPYYMDQAQNKAREIDLIAERLYPIKNITGQISGEIAVRLYVECKFIPSHSLFWLADKDVQAAEDLVCSTNSYRRTNIYTRKHHYLAQSKRVAKLFSTNAKKDQEHEPFYKALNQVLNAMTSMSRRDVTVPALSEKGRQPREILEFPVVVCSSFDQVYAVDFYSNDSPEKIHENFQLEVDYAFMDRNGTQRTRYFLLDIVEFEQLGEFSNWLSKDAKSLAYLISE